MILQWLKDKLLQRTQKTKHDIIKMNWQKAKLEQLLANKESMTPEEFLRAYKRIS